MDEDLYNQELQTYGTRKPQLSSIPHWEIKFHPLEYQSNRIALLSNLQDIVAQCHMSHTGWPYPVYLDRDDILQRGTNFCSGAWGESERIEEWVLFQSLQFYQRLAIEGGNANFAWHVHRKWAESHFSELDVDLDNVPGFIGIERTIQTICFTIDFAHRVAGHAKLTGAIAITMAIKGADGLVLNADPNRHWILRHRITTDSIQYSKSLDLMHLASDRVAIAIDIVRFFFDRMGWTPNDEILNQSVRRTFGLE